MLKDLADKTNVCTSDPHYKELLSFMKEKARREMKQKMRENSEEIQEEVDWHPGLDNKNQNMKISWKTGKEDGKTTSRGKEK